MQQQTLIMRSVLVVMLLMLTGLGVLALILNLPEIRREVKIWMM